MVPTCECAQRAWLPLANQQLGGVVPPDREEEAWWRASQYLEFPRYAIQLFLRIFACFVAIMKYLP